MGEKEVGEEAGPRRRGSPTYLDAQVPRGCSRRGSGGEECLKGWGKCPTL